MFCTSSATCMSPFLLSKMFLTAAILVIVFALMYVCWTHVCIPVPAVSLHPPQQFQGRPPRHRRHHRRMAEPDPPRRRRSTSPMDVDDLERAGKQHAHCESQSPTPERGPAVDAPVIPEPLHARHHALHPPRRSHSISPPPDFQPPADPGHSYPVYFYHRHNPYFEYVEIMAV